MKFSGRKAVEEDLTDALFRLEGPNKVEEAKIFLHRLSMMKESPADVSWDSRT